MKTFKRGDRVSVLNSTLGGKFFVECHSAEVIRKCRGQDDYYMVRMGDETLPRFIDPAAQSDPVAFVQKLNGV